MTIFSSMDMKEKHERVCTLNCLARLLAYALARWKMDGGDGRGERTRKRTCRVERRHKRRLFQQNDWPLTVDKKRKEERRKANTSIVTSLLKIFSSRNGRSSVRLVIIERASLKGAFSTANVLIGQCVVKRRGSGSRFDWKKFPMEKEAKEKR